MKKSETNYKGRFPLAVQIWRCSCQEGETLVERHIGKQAETYSFNSDKWRAWKLSLASTDQERKWTNWKKKNKKLDEVSDVGTTPNSGEKGELGEWGPRPAYLNRTLWNCKLVVILKLYFCWISGSRGWTSWRMRSWWRPQKRAFPSGALWRAKEEPLVALVGKRVFEKDTQVFSGTEACSVGSRLFQGLFPLGGSQLPWLQPPLPGAEQHMWKSQPMDIGSARDQGLTRM